MAGGEEQNPASRRRVWSGKVRGSCLGLPRVPFRWLDGPEKVLVSVGSGLTAIRPLRHAFPANLWPGRSMGDAVGFGATSGRGGGGCMATEEGKEACSMLPAAMATTALCFHGFLCGGVRGRAGGNECEEKSVPPLFAPFVLLLPVGSCARYEAGGRRVWHVSLAWCVHVPRPGVRRGGRRRHHGASTVHSEDA
jgi:hypothetical protein